MKQSSLKTKIFLDSTDPNETQEILSLLGFLDGQTTNPTLIAKSHMVQDFRNRGQKITSGEIDIFYKSIISEIHSIIPHGKISIEVNANNNTTARAMYNQGKALSKWIPDAYIKYPITHEGLKSVGMIVKEGISVNLTLCFSQEQAAGVYAATTGIKGGKVFISPFVGRLDDQNQNGMDLVKNILDMFKDSDKHVEVLAASIRTIDHLLASIELGVDAVTAPYNILKEWGKNGMKLSDKHGKYSFEGLKKISYKKINLLKPWESYNILDKLTQEGIYRFYGDWMEATS